jgi:hypothetical protein
MKTPRQYKHADTCPSLDQHGESMKGNDTNRKTVIGWREWVALPELGIAAIKAKMDTGARTSALHAFRIEPFEADGQSRVRFGVYPQMKRQDIEIFCVADLIDQRLVRDSGGHEEERYVIRTLLRFAGEQWPIELTLTDRDPMQFRMLLGRTALRPRLIVDPSRSYRMGKSQAQSDATTSKRLRLSKRKTR